MLPPPYGAVVHAVCESLAYLIGARLFMQAARRDSDPRLAQPQQFNDGQRWSVVLGAIAGAALGSKLLYWAEYPEHVFAHVFAHGLDPAALWGGKTIVGGLLGGLIGVESAKRWIGVTRSTGDGFVPGLVVGMCLGRLGCFLCGLSDNTYGGPTALPFGVDFGDGVRRHPTQLYEALFLGGLYLALRHLPAAAPLGRVIAGDRFRLFLSAYLLFRLGIDFLKPPFGAAPPGTVLPHLYLGQLTALQLACVAGLVYYLPALLRLAGGCLCRR